MDDERPLTPGERSALEAKVEAWGASLEDVGTHDVPFRLGTKFGLASLLDDTCLGQILLALPYDRARADAWASEQELPDGLEVEATSDSEDGEEDLHCLWLYIEEPIGGESPHPDLAAVVAALSRSWFSADAGTAVGLLSEVLAVMSLNAMTADNGVVELESPGGEGLAYVMNAGDRVRIHLELATDVDPHEANAWIARQPESRSGQLQVVAEDKSLASHILRYTTERPLDLSKISAHDAYAGEGGKLAAAWQVRGTADVGSSDTGWTAVADPIRLDPINAWLLYGDETSFLTPADLSYARKGAHAQIYNMTWTAGKQTQPGDLLFFYFLHPRKAIHFVARAASNAWFSSDPEDEQGRWRATQWWVATTPPIPIPPIALADLKEAFDGDLVMRGHSGRYIPPTTAARLIDLVEPHGISAELAEVLRQPVGLADLPAKEATTLEQWRQIAAGPLALESQVEEHLVEPLLRLALEGHGEFRVQKRLQVARGTADYAVMSNSGPAAIIEVKVMVRKRPNDAWADCKDFLQTRRYADAFDCPSVLMDSQVVHLIAPGADAPHKRFERRSATQTDLIALAQHLTGKVAGKD